MAKVLYLDQQSQEEILRRERKANNAWNKLKRNKTAVLGLAAVCFMIAIAVFAPFITDGKPNEIHPIDAYLTFFEKGHIFGTDELGRDLFTRICYGARVSLLIAAGATIVGGIAGVLLGLLAGYMGGIADVVVMRIMDGVLAFPFILLSIVLMTVLGSGMINVILAIGIAEIPRFARVVRGQVLVVKREEYCNAGRVIGISHFRMLFHHILPNTISEVIVYATLNIASAIISESALSFLGLGIDLPTASWGSILRAGRNSLNTAPHIAAVSGVFILITVIGFNLLGDGIRDVLDPKMKK
ncbi:ABC transporter permease [Clostridium boliviensis]|uniref:ABC transporter permease n=1 Tax=Clostridium boliviensis TaxID=318465 RepID=A0ABU4GQQ2_9CLOT|nr:ABC transporter permease [Clostridium boliviensis]MDW2799945.1 ABC transporter permease [Clostridium boliviensis]